ncbi:hypothetical protein [Vibrio sagamiensis]|uniref:Uncharacterized protein n=1 Tax=Vibrio sagamiensis NBRC 104589 TaxID=1219064 RepID=A0A511QJR9_9VIBR|nr:hypothetical protein [Vibrio sagamiensis]PNQ53803.1 hypothetical protein C1141_19275 [Vibrio agarivorans]GEM77574.1 hypothetical protein VSA01S_36860 [Vibrio sagamiensis NBRC 104589]
MTTNEEDIEYVKKRAFIRKVVGIFLLFVIGIVALNLYLWQQDKSKRQEKEAQIQAEDARLQINFEDDFSVDKLNSQTSVKQLRKAIWKTEVPVVEDSDQQKTADELDIDIDHLYQEIKQIEK